MPIRTGPARPDRRHPHLRPRAARERSTASRPGWSRSSACRTRPPRPPGAARSTRRAPTGSPRPTTGGTRTREGGGLIEIDSRRARGPGGGPRQAPGPRRPGPVARGLGGDRAPPARRLPADRRPGGGGGVPRRGPLHHLRARPRLSRRGAWRRAGGGVGYIQLSSRLDLGDEDPAYGRVWRGATVRRLLDAGAVRPENLVWIGTNGYVRLEEWELARTLGAPMFTPDDVRRRGIAAVATAALEIAGRGCDGVYVSVDMDVVDGGYVAMTGAPQLDGLRNDDVWRAMDVFARGPVGALDVCGLNPLVEVMSLGKTGPALRRPPGAALRVPEDLRGWTPRVARGARRRGDGTGPIGARDAAGGDLPGRAAGGAGLRRRGHRRHRRRAARQHAHESIRDADGPARHPRGLAGVRAKARQRRRATG